MAEPIKIQIAKGILQVNEALNKKSKSGNKTFDQLTMEVGSIKVSVFSNFFDKYKETKELAINLSGKPVILEYTKGERYNDFVSLAPDPDATTKSPVDDPQGSSSEVMTKGDWAIKNRQDMREKLLGRAIEALQSALSKEDYSSTFRGVIIEWAQEFEAYVYGELAEQAPKADALPKAKPEDKPTGLTKEQFVKKIQAIYPQWTEAYIATNCLKVKSLSDWKEPFELALEEVNKLLSKKIK